MFEDFEKIKKEMPRKDPLTEAVGFIEMLATTFILALMVVTFVTRPYIIPTGSMAETLFGAHFRLRCEQCGFRYNHDFNSKHYNMTNPEAIPKKPVPRPPTECPNCGFRAPSKRQRVVKGDKILVLKCIYQWQEPKRWDVVVFKNPLNPDINYIKRLVALPEETVEIFDGDIYIDGHIARKPKRVQDELWMPIYDYDYQPARPRMGMFDNHPKWAQPLLPDSKSGWNANKENNGEFTLSDDQIHRLHYHSSLQNGFKAVHTYNSINFARFMPQASDLKIRFLGTFLKSEGMLGASLSKYGKTYFGWKDAKGNLVLARSEDGKQTVLAKEEASEAAADRNEWVEMECVDHELVFRFGKEEIRHDLGGGKLDAGSPNGAPAPTAAIIGKGNLKVGHIGIFRDLHYLSTLPGSDNQARGANPGGFELNEDEYFVLGDNSPASHDCRWWEKEGVGNNGEKYRTGIVPRDYMVGKALFVIWPSGFRATEKIPVAFIPNTGGMKPIVGGKK